VPSPFEDMGIAAEWFDRVAIGEADRLKIGRINAQGLFHFQTNRPNLKKVNKVTWVWSTAWKLRACS